MNDLHMITNSLYMNSGKLVQNGKNGLNISRTEALREGARLLLRTQIGTLPGSPKEISRVNAFITVRI